MNENRQKAMGFNERFSEYKRQLKLLGLEFRSSYILEDGYSEQEVAGAVGGYLPSEQV